MINKRISNIMIVVVVMSWVCLLIVVNLFMMVVLGLVMNMCKLLGGCSWVMMLCVVVIDFLVCDVLIMFLKCRVVVIV